MARAVVGAFSDPPNYGFFTVIMNHMHRLEVWLRQTPRLPDPDRISQNLAGGAPALHLGKILAMPRKLSHYDRVGRATMVDVSAKAAAPRTASASAFVAMTPGVLRGLASNPKGDPLEVARLAGIMAAKKTSELIPLCHPIALTHVAVDMTVCENGVGIASSASTRAETGVEMEALVAASVAALTVYDMCKALDKGIEIREIVLTSKTGGKSGDYRRAGKKKV